MTSLPSRSPLPTALPAETRVDPRHLRNYVETLGKNGAHSLMVLRDGKAILRAAWRPYRYELPHILFSVSKSFVSVALGFAVGEGLLSLDERVVDIFRDRYPCPPCEFMRRVTIRNLLTMSLGHRGKTDLDFLGANDWLDEALRLYLETEPGTDFSYDNRCTYLCSAILQSRTGLTVHEYLKNRLFETIGVTDSVWEKSAAGINAGGWGLRMGVESMARFGQFLLQRGEWEGKRLLSGEWLDQATAWHIDTKGKSIIPAEDCWSGYGWFFWRSTHPGAYRADGALGQTLIVMPTERTVVAMTAGTATRNKLIEATWEYLLPGLDAVGANHREEQEKLEETIVSLAIAPSSGGKTASPTAARAARRKFTAAKNRLGITSLAYQPGDPECLDLEIEKNVLPIRAGHGVWTECDLGESVGKGSDVSQVFHRHAAATAAWDGDILELRIAFVESPFIDTLRLHFAENCVRGHYTCGPHFGARGGATEFLAAAE